MGGVGKTVSAIALAHDKDIRRYFKDGIYFVSVGRNPDLAEKRSELLSDGFGIEEQKPSIANIREVFQNKKALLILDNVWEARDIREFDISSSTSKILITSRQKDILRGKVYTIKVMSPKQALKLFKNIGGNITQKLEDEAKDILKKIGYLPLAVHIIGYTLRDRGYDDYINILEKLENVLIKRIELRSVENEEHKNLFIVIDISVEYLEDWVKEYYLSLSIFKNEYHISKECLGNYWGDNFIDVKNILIDASLLQEIKNENNTINYMLHDLQKDYIGIKDNIVIRYKSYVDIYTQRFSNKWVDIGYRDMFFHKYFINIFEEYGSKEITRDISEHLLKSYQYFTINEITNIIQFLGLNEKKVAVKTIDNIKNRDTQKGLLHILGESHTKSISFAKAYLDIDIKLQDMNVALTIECLKILKGIEQKKVESFAKAYLDIDIKLQDINAALAIECLNILKGIEQKKVELFAKIYIDIDIDIKLQDINAALAINA